MCGSGHWTQKSLVGRPEGKSAFGRPRCRLQPNIWIYGKEKLECVDLNRAVQGREKWRAVVKAAMNCQVP
jgi:hypothetical protein